jgi:hypothetical protein
LTARLFAFTAIDPSSFSAVFASSWLSTRAELAQIDVQDVAMPEVVPHLVVKLLSS